MVLPALLSPGAALFYGIGGALSSKKLKGETPLNMAIGQQLAAGIILLPVAIFFLPRPVPGPNVILSVLGLALLSTLLGYILYFRLITNQSRPLVLHFWCRSVFGALWGLVVSG